jgi:hypothetical protein
MAQLSTTRLLVAHLLGPVVDALVWQLAGLRTDGDGGERIAREAHLIFSSPVLHPSSHRGHSHRL